MNSFTDRTNPFVLMLDPEAVIKAMEGSEPLRGLSGRVCRPLDKPLIPTLVNTTISEFDAGIDEGSVVDRCAHAYREGQPGLRAVH